MVRFVKAARPPASVAIGFTPDRAGPPVASAAGTVPPALATGLPLASCTWTAGCGPTGTPLWGVVGGGVVKASWPAAAAVMLKAELVPSASPAAAAVRV